MSNMLLAYSNRVDTAVLYDGAWMAALPLANLKNTTIGKVARSTDAALLSTKLTADVGTGQIARVIALVGHNFSLSARFRIRSANISDFSVVLTDSGWTAVWPVVYPYGTLEFEDPRFWTGTYSAEEIAGYTASLIYILPNTTRAQFWRIEFDDTTNSAGYVQVGRLFIGKAWQPSHNMSVGAQLGLETDTEAQKAISGAEYFDRRRPRRVSRFTIANIGDDEAYGVAFEIMRQMGVDGEVVFIFDPSDTVHALRRRWLGRLRQLSPIEHPYPINEAVGFEISERL